MRGPVERRVGVGELGRVALVEASSSPASAALRRAAEHLGVAVEPDDGRARLGSLGLIASVPVPQPRSNTRSPGCNRRLLEQPRLERLLARREAITGS